MMSNPPPPPKPPDDGQPPKPPLPVIYPDADPHNENWLRILAQRRQQEQQAKSQQKETPANGDIQ